MAFADDTADRILPILPEFDARGLDKQAMPSMIIEAMRHLLANEPDPDGSF